MDILKTDFNGQSHGNSYSATEEWRVIGVLFVSLEDEAKFSDDPYILWSQINLQNKTSVVDVEEKKSCLLAFSHQCDRLWQTGTYVFQQLWRRENSFEYFTNVQQFLRPLTTVGQQNDDSVF